jgi:hypothetical protein
MMFGDDVPHGGGGRRSTTYIVHRDVPCESCIKLMMLSCQCQTMFTYSVCPSSLVRAIGGRDTFWREAILFGREATAVMEFLLLMCIVMNNEESVSSLEAMNFEISWQLLQRNQLC